MIPHQVRLLGPNLWVGSSATSSVKRGSSIIRSPAPDVRLTSLGQNQAASAIAAGIAPNTTAQGEKIDDDEQDTGRAGGDERPQARFRYRLAKVGSGGDDGCQEHFLVVDAKPGDDRQFAFDVPQAACGFRRRECARNYSTGGGE